MFRPGSPFAARDRGGTGFLAVLCMVAVGVPLLNQVVPASSPLHLSQYGIALIGKYLCYGMLALAIDLIWGYCGILSLGHAAFFALGGYAMGMYLMRQIGARGVYGNPVLPDFMVFLNWKQLPWFWYGFNHFLFAMLMVVVAPALLAWVFGWFAFRSRVTGVYFSIITQALTYALMLAFFRNNMGFGGNNGFTDFKDILGYDLHSDATHVVLLVATCIALGASYLACRAIVESRAGRVIRAIRDGESRTRFLGYPVESFKLWLFVFSAVIAGIAGALYVPQIGIINPSEFAPINSIEAVIWVAVGGRGTLYGAIAGAAVVNYAKTYLTGALPEVWLYALGALFVLVTLFLPRGIAGLIPARKRPEKKIPNGEVGHPDAPPMGAEPASGDD
ncbi:MAG TPA: urea ABC transporter permease subunit UrtC [Candidatus Sulfopaludibacter sp.]|nr:urea ABC transporter permease subunit UrtC [Candidatus Sulfopaludibacter sp.]